MDYQAYVINLKHAEKRWEHVRHNLEERGIPYRRIEGVYGKDLPNPVKGYDERTYHILNGKVTNPGEVGCYFSHIKALREFLESDDAYALILEDDVTLPENIQELLDAAIGYADDWDLLRLTSSREGTYVPFGDLPGNHQIVYNTRVLKNTGAYFINRAAAQKCVDKMLPMKLPFDEALDRDWDFGFRTACIVPFPIKLEEEMESQIPRAQRIRLYRSTTFHLFHTLTHFERIWHRRKQIRDPTQESEMIVVRITGGMGNQMFQYAFARALQASGKPVVLQWHGHRTASGHNGFELDTIFENPISQNIRLTNAFPALNLRAWFLRKTSRQREPSNLGFNPEFLDAASGYLDGYWQTEKYFIAIPKTIRNDFKFKPVAGNKNLELIKRIKAEPCVSIHVRRGDYVNHPGLGGICTADYYRNALNQITAVQPDIIPVIFSDDIPFCQKLFSDQTAVFIDWNQGANSWMDMALMSQCRHHIIANSSFSWWGAWLSDVPDGLTIGPEKWFSDAVENTNPDIYPGNWTLCSS